MSKTLTTILIVLAVLIVAGGLFFVGTMFGRTTAFAPQNGLTQAWGNHPFGMGGMMGRFGGDKSRGYGPGMMGGYGYNYANVAPLTVDQAKAAAGKYVAALNNSDLAVGEVMIFDNNAYVVVKETSTGRGAFELLVDPVSQVAYPEHGPNMMWNLKYGGLNHQNMMGGYGHGMMGNYGWNGLAPSGSIPEMTVTSEQAIQDAQKYLDADVAGAKAADDPIQFYGYYTLDFTKDGKVAGMLSVNGYTGQVFLHTWHGAFIEEAAN